MPDSDPTPSRVPPAGSHPLAGPRDRLDLFAITVLTLMCVALALGQVAIKIANAGISPILQAGLRSLAASVLLGAWMLARGIKLAEQDGTHWAALLAGLFFAAEFAFLYPGLLLTTASHAVILLYTSPFVVAVGAHFLFPGDRLTPAKTAGLIAAFLGAAIVVLGREEAAAGRGPTLPGDLLCLAGAFAWGFLTLTVRASRLRAVPPERVTLAQLLVSGIALSGLSLALAEPGITAPTPLVFGAFAYTVVVIGFVVFTTGFWLMTRYPASRVMAFYLLTPVFGVIAGHAILGEALSTNLLAGLALVVTGLWLVNRPPAAR